LRLSHLSKLQVTERFPQEEFDFTHLFSIFDIENFQGLTDEELSEYGNQEIEQLVSKLSSVDDGTKKFYCKAPFIDTTDDSVMLQVRSEHLQDAVHMLR
jgi:hypothetical protein